MFRLSTTAHEQHVVKLPWYCKNATSAQFTLSNALLGPDIQLQLPQHAFCVFSIWKPTRLVPGLRKTTKHHVVILLQLWLPVSLPLFPDTNYFIGDRTQLYAKDSHIGSCPTTLITVTSRRLRKASSTVLKRPQTAYVDVHVTKLSQLTVNSLSIVVYSTVVCCRCLLGAVFDLAVVSCWCFVTGSCQWRPSRKKWNYRYFTAGIRLRRLHLGPSQRSSQ